MIKRKITFLVFTPLFTAVLLTSTAYAELSVYGGLERFNWREYDAAGVELLQENGYRLVTGIVKVAEGDAGLLLDYEGRLYGNEVDYDGETQDGVPLKTTTGYAGFLAELKPRFRFQPASLDGNYLDITTAFGIENWVRVLHNGTDQIGRSISGYTEEYLIMYVRLGLERRPRSEVRHWHGGAGIKYPFYTYEKAYLSHAGFDRDVILRPDPDISLYAKGGYRFSEKWSFSLYYDSYNFKQSPTVPAASGGTQFLVRQPESLQYTIGFILNYHFGSKSDDS